MKIKTSISEFELLRCDDSRSFFNYCDNFNNTYLFDSISIEDIECLIEYKNDLCKQYKGLNKWYTNIFSAFYSYIPNDVIENSKGVYLLIK